MLPDWTVWTAAALFILSYLLYAEVLRENEYLTRTIEVQEGQKVIDTGLYGIGSRFPDIIHNHARIHTSDRQEDQERRRRSHNRP